MALGVPSVMSIKFQNCLCLSMSLEHFHRYPCLSIMYKRLIVEISSQESKEIPILINKGELNTGVI